MSVDGTWQLVIDSPMGKQHVSVDLKDEGGQLTGTVTNTDRNETTELFEGSAQDAEVTWKAKAPQLGMTLTFTMSVHGDAMTGKVKAGMFGSFPVSGQRA